MLLIDIEQLFEDNEKLFQSFQILFLSQNISHSQCSLQMLCFLILK